MDAHIQPEADPLNFTATNQYCRDFISGTLTPITVVGTWGALEDFKSRLDHGCNQQITNMMHDPLHALETSLRPICRLRGLPLPSLEQLRSLHLNAEYRRVVESVVQSLGDQLGSHRCEEYRRMYVASSNLSGPAMRIVLHILSRITGQVFQLGIAKHDASHSTWNLSLCGSLCERPVTDTVWVITGQDCEYWSGFAPNPDMWVSADVHDDAAVRQDYHASALSGRDVRRNEVSEGGSLRASTLINLRRDGKRPDKIPQGPSRPDPKSDLVNQYIKESPANDYALPKELMTSITLEELVTYFPNHCITWPGLALLLSQKGWTAASVSDHISRSHGWTDLSQDERTKQRNTIGTKMNAAVRSILGPIQGAKWSISVARDTAWLQSNEKLNSLLWTAPLCLPLRAPCHLQNVGENIINHPQGQFAATVQAAMDAHAAGEELHVAVPRQLPHRELHPLALARDQPAPKRQYVRRKRARSDSNAEASAERAKRRRAGPAPPPGASADDIFHDYPSHMYLENMLTVQLSYSDAQIQHAISAAELPEGSLYDRAVPGHRRKHALRARAVSNSTTYEEERRKFWNERREKADKGLISWKVRALRTENGLGRKQKPKEERRERRLEKHLKRALLED